MKNIVLKVTDVKKSFILPTEQSNGIKQAFINWTKGVKGYREQKVLDGVSFSVERGDFVGIVGKNGSGKSTLLKIISQIYTPDYGRVEVNGKLIPFIELGVGFNPELTGRENIYLNGALLGFSHKEISHMYDDIVDFAELHDFMDQKLKNYSSGMQVRLAFSIAIKAQGDILVLDEVLAVGDEAFQRKCDDFFNQIKDDKSKTVILVTHSMEAVKKYCNKAILIKDGRVANKDSVYSVASEYSNDNIRSLKKTSLKKEVKKGWVKVSAENEKYTLDQKDKNAKFNIEYKYSGDLKPILAYSILDNKRGGVVFDSGPFFADGNEGKVRFKAPVDIFNSGEIKIIASLREAKNLKDDLLPVDLTNNQTSAIFIMSNKYSKYQYGLLNDKNYRVEQIK